MLGCRVLPGDTEAAVNVAKFVDEELNRWGIVPPAGGNKIVITSDRGTNVIAALNSARL